MNTHTETKHTPGPWTVEENVSAGGVQHFAVTARHAGKDWMPCSVTPMRLVRDVDRANARLIAAAPELLGCLVRCQFAMRQAQRDFELLAEGASASNLTVHIDSASAAISKATEGAQ